MNEFGCDIKLLSQLLNPHQNSEDDEVFQTTTKTSVNLPSDATPSNIGAAITPENKIQPKKKICEEDYYNYHEEYTSKNDWKKTPVWDISYRQQVTASDVFLQMGGKTPSTSSCENMIIKIKLPGENRQNIDLKVLENRIEVNSSNFYLDIPLPHLVNPQHGNAQYDNDSEQLIVTLVMNREFDFINF